MELVTIGWFTEPWYAHIANGRLSAEDIFSCVVHEHHISANWMYSNALGNVKIQVLPQDREKAERVLKKVMSGEYEADLLPLFDELESCGCPQCRSLEVTGFSGYSRTCLAFVFYFISGIAFPPSQDFRTCTLCHHKWKVGS